MMKTQQFKLPKHIAIIMDGNGRWAEHQNLPRSKGHYEGVKRVDELVDYASELGINYITLFTFSTENWNRPETEINLLMELIGTVLKQKIDKLKRINVRFQIIGKHDRIPDSILNIMKFVIEETKNNTGLVLNLAFNYGSRLEITDAVRILAGRVKNGTLEADEITEEMISSELYTKNIPDPDLLIRTSGERRISNFLLWQLSYAELYFSETFWPDFTKEEFLRALEDYTNRDRRFGKINHGGNA